jgi:hypothetical protein
MMIITLQYPLLLIIVPEFLRHTPIVIRYQPVLIMSAILQSLRQYSPEEYFSLEHPHKYGLEDPDLNPVSSC